MNNSFYKWNDKYVDKFLIDLDKDFFWSRRYEYPHIFNLIKEEKHFKILDAATGTYHPFKYMLAKEGYDISACDLSDLIYDESKTQMKKYGYNLSEELFNKVKFTKADISILPYKDKEFDAVACISVIEHIVNNDIIFNILKEFRRVLRDNGKIYLTIDYPVIKPNELLELASKANLVLDGESNFDINDDCISSEYFGSKLLCYNVILRKEGN